METGGGNREDQSMSKSEKTTLTIRLPKSLKGAIENFAKEDGCSLNQFITLAAAEKLSALNTAQFFEERRKRADMETFRKILHREGGEPPRPGDEMP
jgi:uncharacterized protein (DUF1778 family)